MSQLSKFRPLVHLLTAALLLLLCACSFSESVEIQTPPEPEEATVSSHYINFNIVVSSGNENTMRVPTADNGDYNNGDGREIGSERENKVTGITLILYQDEAGINTTKTDTKLEFVKYYTVNRTDEENMMEYTTGNQPLENTDIKLNTTYHAIVVANWDLTHEVYAGQTTVAEVRDMITSNIYSGTGLGVDAANFVMASASDISFTLNKAENTIIDGTPAMVYSFESIPVERLAARIDFWTKNAEYSEESEGYEYPVWKTLDTNSPTSADKFVLTAVTPFNLYNGNEYLLKRIQYSGTFTYLADEHQSNFVIDPGTTYKSVPLTNQGLYSNTLSSLVSLDDAQHTLSSTNYYQSTIELYKNKDKDNSQFATFTGIGEGIDNFILCYTMENALTNASPLYYYATGVAIEGDYYKGGDANQKEHRIYYGFLRHRGEPTDKDSYDINTREDFRGKETIPVGNVDMNFSVVRNNIYRVYIDKITEKGSMKIEIQVKNWDEFTHDIIYM